MTLHAVKGIVLAPVGSMEPACGQDLIGDWELMGGVYEYWLKHPEDERPLCKQCQQVILREQLRVARQKDPGKEPD